MEADFQIRLSSGEILIIAALLGYESIFGVDADEFSAEDVDLKQLIRRYVRQLERKKLIRYELDGTLYIISSLRKAIDCICNSDTVGLFSTNLKSGKKASVYIMERESFVTLIERLGNGEFNIRLTDSVPLDALIPDEIFSSQYCEMHEMMLFEEAEFVHEQIEAFDNDGAERRLNKHLKSVDSSKAILKILSGGCGYLSVQIHRKGTKMYNAVYNTLLVMADNCTISLKADENNVLCFEAVAPETVAEQLRSQFKLNGKGGAD